jgi:hypothetical protein
MIWNTVKRNTTTQLTFQKAWIFIKIALDISILIKTKFCRQTENILEQDQYTARSVVISVRLLDAEAWNWSGNYVPYLLRSTFVLQFKLFSLRCLG